MVNTRALNFELNFQVLEYVELFSTEHPAMVGRVADYVVEGAVLLEQHHEVLDGRADDRPEPRDAGLHHEDLREREL